MPESDEGRELGGLARSIDALFSQRPASESARGANEGPGPGDVGADDAAATQATPPPLPTAATPPPLPAEATAPALPTETVPPPLPAEFVPPPLPADVPVEPDPFETLDAPPLGVVGAHEPAPLLDVESSDDEEAADGADDSELTSSLGVIDMPGEGLREEADPMERTSADADLGERAAVPPPSGGDSAEPDTDLSFSSEGLPDSGLESDSEGPDRASDSSVPEPSEADLREAVDAFLAGHRGSAEELGRIAADLRERLALDPLADAVEHLVAAADGSDDDPALELARKIVNPAVASRLVQRMAQEEDEARRAEYVDMSARLGMVMANAFKGALTDATDARARRACYDGLIALGDTSRPVIEAMVEDENLFLVQNAVAILGEVGGDRALELVTSALASTDPRVRREALASLAKLDDEDSAQLILASLEDPSARVRAAAAEAAGRLGLERALRPMLALLEDDELDDEERIPVQVQVLEGLGLLGDPGAVQALEKRAVGSLFSKPPTEVRVAAYRALNAIGTPHARQLLEKARDDKDPVIRTRVRALEPRD